MTSQGETHTHIPDTHVRKGVVSYHFRSHTNIHFSVRFGLIYTIHMFFSSTHIWLLGEEGVPGSLLVPRK